MFREIPSFFLTGTVNHQNSRFSAIIAQIWGVPAEVQLDVEYQVVFIRICDAVGAQHGTLIDEDVC